MNEDRLLLGVEALALQGGDPGVAVRTYVHIEFSLCHSACAVYVCITSATGPRVVHSPALYEHAHRTYRVVGRMCGPSRAGALSNVHHYDSSFLMDLAGNSFHLFSFVVFFLSCLGAAFDEGQPPAIA